ncbi:MAG: zinc ribbon domain-containing protein [Candidatus Zixiibacteriota bacterium]
MPLFEFKCTECAKIFEELVANRDEHPPCPSCGSMSTEKQLASFSVGGGQSHSAPMACGRPDCGPGFG